MAVGVGLSTVVGVGLNAVVRQLRERGARLGQRRQRGALQPCALGFVVLVGIIALQRALPIVVGGALRRGLRARGPHGRLGAAVGVGVALGAAVGVGLNAVVGVGLNTVVSKGLGAAVGVGLGAAIGVGLGAAVGAGLGAAIGVGLGAAVGVGLGAAIYL